MIVIKSPREIALMRESGRICALCFERLKSAVKPGVSTMELNDLCDRTIRGEGGYPASLGYEGFPYAVCVSVNDELVHGFASATRFLREGDIVSVDIVVSKNGYLADAARTYPVGKVGGRAARLIRVTREAFYRGVEAIRPGARVGDISHAVESYVESSGYHVARDFTGHGIGTGMHEDPAIPNYGPAGTGALLREGMTIAVEPMVTEGRSALSFDPNGWTARTRDGKLSAHYENTLAVTKTGAEILTISEGSD